MAGSGTAHRENGFHGRLSLLWALGLLLGSPAWPAATPIAWSSLDQPVQRTLALGESAVYAIELVAGQSLRVKVDQEGIDTQEILRAPSGTVLLKLDVPSGRFGPEVLSVVAAESGPYTLEVQALESPGPPAFFRVEAVRRTATAEDRLAAEADRDYTAAWELEDSPKSEDRARAADLYQAALRERQDIGDQAGTAWVLQRLGVLQLRKGDPASALRFLQESLSRFRDLGDRRASAFALRQVAAARELLGDGKGAVAALEEVLGIWRELGEADNEATTLNRLGNTLFSQGRAQEALASHQQSLALFRKLGDRQQESIVLTHLGGTLEALGKPFEAREQYSRALSIAREIGDRSIEAASLNGLGTLYSRLGQPGDALASFTAALAFYRQAGDPAAQAVALANVGSYLIQIGSLDAAREVLLQALPLQRDPRREATTRISLGRIAVELGHFDEARELFDQALTLQRKMQDRSGEATTLEAQGILKLRAGEPAQAAEPLRRSLELFHAIGSLARVAEAKALLGKVQAALGDAAAARTSFAEALSLAESVGRVDGQAQILTEMARLEKDRDPEAARRHAEAAIERYESFRAQISGERLRISQSATLRDAFDLYVDVLMQLDRRQPGSGLDVRALEAAEKARARGLLDRLGQQVEIREGDPELLAREASLRYQLNALAERRFRLSPDQDAEELAEVQRKIEAVSAEYPIVDAQIQAHNPRYAALKSPDVRVSEIQSLLGEGTVLLEYALGEPRSYLWLVTPDAVSSFELPGREVIEPLARRVHERLRSPNAQGGTGEREDLAELSRIVLGPVLGHLAGRRLVVVPDGALQYVPFSALPVPDGEMSATVPLLVKHEMVTLPSVAVLREIRRTEASRGPAPAALAILADPVYESDDPRVRIALAPRKPAPPSTPQAASDLLRSARQPNVGARLSRLTWSRREAEGIAAEAKGRNVLLALDFQANRDLATGPDLARYRLIHFATHGFLDAEHPDLSALALSQTDQEGRPRDGFLRLQDVYHLHLNADLVVLSGCETALGKNLRGEGIVGLTHGFFHAGSSQVLASLWPVRDRATAELMQRFYRGLFKDGLPASAALRQAQISMWKERPWRDPYFWAAFVLQGDWQAGGR